MIIDKTYAEYVLAVAAAIATLRVRAEHLTDICSECGQRVTYLDNDRHLVMAQPNNSPATTRVAVIVGCEGYWMVDPRLVGIDAPMWQPIAIPGAPVGGS